VLASHGALHRRGDLCRLTVSAYAGMALTGALPVHGTYLLQPVSVPFLSWLERAIIRTPLRRSLERLRGRDCGERSISVGGLSIDRINQHSIEPMREIGTANP